MNDLKNNLKEIFDLVSAIPVSGQYVDVMASVRSKLRLTYKLAETAEAEKKEVPEDG